MKVEINKVKDVIEMVCDGFEQNYFLDTKDNTIIAISDDIIGIIQDVSGVDISKEFNLSERKKKEVNIAVKVLKNRAKRYISLPTEEEISEREIMVEYVNTLDDKSKKDRLENILSDKSNIKYFKDACYDLGLFKVYTQFRSQYYENMAINWCNGKHILYK